MENLCDINDKVNNVEKSISPIYNKTLNNTLLDIKYIKINNNNVMTIIKDGDTWFKGNDVAKLLDYKRPCDAICDNVQKVDKKIYGELSINTIFEKNKSKKRDYSLQKDTIFININGVKTLLLKTKKPIEKNLTELFGINILNYKILTKEQKFLNYIIKIFKHHDIRLQYPILNYKIDLYILDLNLAIECDENGHNNYNQELEKIRQSDIEHLLKCKFIRFNPDDEYFDINNVISDIYTYIYFNFIHST